MTTYTVQAPDGKKLTLEGPPGAKPEDVIAQAQKLYQPKGQPSPPKPQEPAAAPSAANPNGYFSGMGDRLMAPMRQAGHQVMEDVRTAYGKGAPNEVGKPGGARAQAAENLGGDLLSAAQSPMVGYISALTKLPADKVQALMIGASMAGGRAPEGAIAERAPIKPKEIRTDEALAAERAKHVKLLEREGVEIPEGRRTGGTADTVQSIGKSSIYTRKGLMDAEDHSVRTMNVALYNRALKYLGEKYKAAPASAGNSGVGYVKQRFDAAYNRTLPNAKLQFDDQLIGQLADLSDEAAAATDKGHRYNSIINKEILGRFKTGEMNGKDYKALEETLGKKAANYKNSSLPEDRDLGAHLEETLAHVREAMERSSPPEVAAELKRINQGYAIYSRIRDAAAARKNGRGIITPSDLMGAVKKGDKTLGKGAFARGDAILHDFGSAAVNVLPDKLNDSGTELRGVAHGRGLVGASLGGGLGFAAGGPIGGGIGGALGAAGDLAASTVTNKVARDLVLRKSRAAVAAAKKEPAPPGKTIIERNVRRLPNAGVAAGGAEAGSQQ